MHKTRIKSKRKCRKPKCWNRKDWNTKKKYSKPKANKIQKCSELDKILKKNRLKMNKNECSLNKLDNLDSKTVKSDNNITKNKLRKFW